LKKTEINDRRRSAALTSDIPLSTKVGTKFHRQVAVAQSVYFARGLRNSFVCLFVGGFLYFVYCNSLALSVIDNWRQFMVLCASFYTLIFIVGCCRINWADVWSVFVHFVHR
jgi:hypothetical protein